MKRVVVGGILSLLFIAAAFSGASRADAAAEFCPAYVYGFAPVGGTAAGTLLAYRLRAYGPRSVQGDVVALTDAGWYRVAFPMSRLTPRTGTAVIDSVRFKRTRFLSDRLYALFPKRVKVLAVFVTDAVTKGDDIFGWDARGVVSCQAPAGFPPNAAVAEQGRAAIRASTLHPAHPSPTPLPIPTPGPAEPIAEAQAIQPPGPTNCARPAFNPRVTRLRQAIAPALWSPIRTLSAAVVVFIGADGKLKSADTYLPTGYPAYDQAALDAAEHSTYAPGASFCEPAPGRALFRVNFTP